MGNKARYKKDGKEGEIFGTRRKEELFLHYVHPSLPLETLTYGTSCAARLGIKYIHA